MLADLSADDARLLHDKILPLVIAETIIFSDGIADLTEFIRAQELGALTGASGGLNWNLTWKLGTAVLPFWRGRFILEASKEITMLLPGMMLTRFGKELLKLSNDYPPVPDDYIDRLAKYLEARELKVRKLA